MIQPCFHSWLSLQLSPCLAKSIARYNGECSAFLCDCKICGCLPSITSRVRLQRACVYLWEIKGLKRWWVSNCVVVYKRLNAYPWRSCTPKSAWLTLLRDVIICLMTMRSAKTRTLVTEDRSKRAAFTIPVLSLNTVTRPSDWGSTADPTSVNWAMASPASQKRRTQVWLNNRASLTHFSSQNICCFVTTWLILLCKSSCQFVKLLKLPLSANTSSSLLHKGSQECAKK